MGSQFLLIINVIDYFLYACQVWPNLANSKGEKVGGIFGSITLIQKAIKIANPQFLGIIFDSKSDKLDESSQAQLAIFEKLLEMMGLTVICNDKPNQMYLELAACASSVGKAVIVLDRAAENFSANNNIIVISSLSELQSKIAVLKKTKPPRSKKSTNKNLPLNFNLESFCIKPPELVELANIFEKLELYSWCRNLIRQFDAKQRLTLTMQRNYEIIRTQKSFTSWLSLLSAAPLFAFDLETTSLDYISAQIVGVALAVAPDKAAYIPLAHDYSGAPKQLSRTKVLQALKPLLESAVKAKVGHHLKYDSNVLRQYGIELRGIAFDTLIEAHVANNSLKQYNLDYLTLLYLARSTTYYEDVVGKGAKQLTFNQVAISIAGAYAAEDADVCLRLHNYLWPRLNQKGSISKIITEIEMPLVPILSEMECNGVLVDVQKLTDYSAILAGQLAALQENIYALAGEKFNIHSTKQLQAILYNKLSLPVLKKTASGQAATNEEILLQLAEQHELPKAILRYRELSKLKSTYTDALINKIHPNTGRVHTSYHQAGTATGRLSSSEPNLQNIPVRTEEGRYIRSAFIAPEGYRLIAADYSQIELRIMAHLSCDEGLLSAFANGCDIHQATAAEIFNVSLEQVSSEQRRNAKAINFGLLYGMSPFGLAKQLGVNFMQAQKFMNLYFSRYPKVLEYMNKTREFVNKHGYVTTITGRALFFTQLPGASPKLKNSLERAAINAPIQGSAADIIKIAMIQTDAALKKAGLDVKMLMQVHDELVFEAHSSDTEKVKHIISENMVNAISLKVPLEVQIQCGNNWDEAH